MRFQILLITIFVTTASIAQNSQQSNDTTKPPTPCDAYINSGVDSLSGAFAMQSKKDLVLTKDGKPALSVAFIVVDRSIVFSVTVIGDVFCIDETNKILFTFRDGTTLELPHNGVYNCDGEFSLFFFGAFGKKKEYVLLTMKAVDKIKVGLRKSIVDKNRPNFIEVLLSPEESSELKMVATCLVE